MLDSVIIKFEKRNLEIKNKFLFYKLNKKFNFKNNIRYFIKLK